MTATEVAGRMVTGPVEHWYRDTLSCLQATFATVLIHAGHDPLEVLGAAWDFYYKPGDFRPEEFYYPCRIPGNVGRSLAPHHDMDSEWRRPSDPSDPLGDLDGAVAAGELHIAAVDNFALPFRPAFNDVHAAHLVVVYGIDRGRGLVYVSDAMPPAFHGAIRIEDFERAWSSTNPSDAGDVFFSDAEIGSRTLQVRLGEHFPAMDRSFLRTVLTANEARMRGAWEQDGGWGGLAGLERFSADVCERVGADNLDVCAEVYTYGWGPQAQASLHGELLRRWGGAHRVPEVSEAGRLVDLVAHSWTGLRVSCAHGSQTGTRPDITRHVRRLASAYAAAVEGVAVAIGALEET